MRTSIIACPVPRKTWVCSSGISATGGFIVCSLADALEILRDSLKLFDQIPDLARQCVGSLFHAVVNMILDEFFLGVADGFLYGVQLLRQIHARASSLQHVDHGREMSLGAFQPCGDLGGLGHHLDLIWTYPI